MIKKLNYVAVIILVMSSCIITNAQQPLKFGHINSTLLVSMMPEAKSADSLLEKINKEVEGQLKTMYDEYQSKMADYQKTEAGLSELVKQAKQKELTDLEQRIRDFQQTAQESFQKKKEGLYTPIFKTASDAIHEVAKENGFSYIFDSSLGVLLYAPDGDDVIDLVKKKLKITTPTPTAPPKPREK
jgi:outer membrane protein